MLTRWHGLLEQTASGDGGAFTGDAKWGGGRFSATFADSPRGGAHGLGKRAGRDHLHDLPLPVGVETAAAVAFEPTPEVLAAARHSTEALEATRGSKSWTNTVTRADNDDEEVSSSADGSPSQQPKMRSLTTPRPLLRSDSAAAAGSRKQMLKQHTERTQRQKNNSKWRKRRCVT